MFKEHPEERERLERMAEETYPEKIIEVVEKLFPKGDKARGRALLLQAVAYLEGKEVGKKKVMDTVRKVFANHEICANEAPMAFAEWEGEKDIVLEEIEKELE